MPPSEGHTAPITRCPHCGEDQGDREAFKEHIEHCGDTESRYERAKRLFDSIVFPAIILVIGLFEAFVSESSAGLALVLIAVLWVRQYE